MFISALDIWTFVKLVSIILISMCGLVIGRHLCIVACGTLDSVSLALSSSVQSISWWLPMFSLFHSADLGIAGSGSRSDSAFQATQTSLDLAVPLLQALGPPQHLLRLGGPVGVLTLVAWKAWSMH